MTFTGYVVLPKNDVRLQTVSGHEIFFREFGRPNDLTLPAYVSCGPHHEHCQPEYQETDVPDSRRKDCRSCGVHTYQSDHCAIPTTIYGQGLFQHLYRPPEFDHDQMAYGSLASSNTLRVLSSEPLTKNDLLVESSDA